MIEIVQRQRDAIVSACRKFRVGRLELFGSAARGDFDPQKSDLDFVADFLPPLQPGIADRFFGLTDELEKIFARHVDVLTESMLRNPILREEVNRDRVPVYDHRIQKATA